MFTFSLLGIVAAVGWMYLAVAHGQFWRLLLPSPCSLPASCPSVDIIVPARNEADVLPVSLASLLHQTYEGPWQVILVDDHSTDGTSAIARNVAAEAHADEHLTIIDAPDLAPGWSGKVAAMNAGLRASQADLVLFTDADIVHVPLSLQILVAHAEEHHLDLVSRMVRLNCCSWPEKLLIPAFVFFFAMLYPFRSANDPRSSVAAAAGGTMLVRRSMLRKIGDLSAIKSALIDDCSLAKAIKKTGGKIELMLTDQIESIRPYPSVRDVWSMVARTAYTQLRLSPLLLIGTVTGMTVLYIIPIVLFVLAPNLLGLAIGFATLCLMTALYVPMVRFYGLAWVWALTLPVAALIYGAATIDSARLYYLGRGGHWKGRAQA